MDISGVKPSVYEMDFWRSYPAYQRPTSSQAGEELNTSLKRDRHLFTLGFSLQCQK